MNTTVRRKIVRKMALGCVAGSLLYLASSCVHVEYAVPPTYAAAGVHVTQARVEYDDDEIQISMVVTNDTDQPMVVDRNQILCALPSGQLLSRSNAMVFGIPTAPTYLLPPRGNHEVQLAYKVPPNTPHVSLLLSRGIFANNQPVDLPAYVITRKLDK